VYYGPLHDSQMMVDGAAARAVSELARRRWRAATRQPLDRIDATGDPWPPTVTPDFRKVDVAISRTAPRWRGNDGIREGMACTKALLSAARRSIFVEQQYLTVMSFGRILAHALRKADGPEVVLIVNDRLEGSAERIYMGGNRDRLLSRLKRADRFGRLRVVHPVVPDIGGDCMVKVHAKLIIIDDHFLRVGSSNLNYRSTGLDTECDLTIEARCEQDRRKIAEIRNRLLAEHLDATVETVAARVAATGSIVKTVDMLSGGPRSLRPYRIAPLRIGARRVWGTFLIDPGRPLRLMSPLRRLVLRVASAGRSSQ
jgi:phosphatidylserine/phosphatidylglycerophosphate/cardiolipin synthase-like enzyme